MTSAYPSPFYPVTGLKPRPAGPAQTTEPPKLSPSSDRQPLRSVQRAQRADHSIVEHSTVRRATGKNGGTAVNLASAASPSRKSSGSAATRVASGRFAYAVHNSPLQNLEQELKFLGNKEESADPRRQTIGRSLSKHQQERLYRSTTVTSRTTGGRSPQFDETRTNSAIGSSQTASDDQMPSQNSMEISSATQSHGKLSSTTMNGVIADRDGGTVIRDHKHNAKPRNKHWGFFRHKYTSDSNGYSVKGATPATGQVARLTIEDGELEDDDPADEYLSEDPAPKYDVSATDEGMPFTLSEVLTFGLIILPTSPDTPFFHMVQNPLLQQPGKCHPYYTGEEKYPRLQRLSTAKTASYSTPDLATIRIDSRDQLKTNVRFKSTSTLMVYADAISPRPVPRPSLFTPKLSIKCGPLLRYIGLRRHPKNTRRGSAAKEEREVWRGTVMIVTTDTQSIYDPPPTLRLFVQTIDALPDDTGKFPENAYPIPDGRRGSTTTVWRRKDGEKRQKFKQVEALKLSSERGVTWWRFGLEVELNDFPARIAYRINHGPAIAFWVPGRGQTMNVLFHSCNGFSMGVNPAEFCGPNPMWRDVLNAHREKPFHVMIGGGDQVYNDAVAKQTTLFKEWLSLKNPVQKYSAEFTPEMADELELFYLERYCMWFSQGLFGVANSQIPMINIWDDHDIIDGFGSYPSHFNGCRVFCGLGDIAYKYYLLFQHQSKDSETEEQEPSWILGHSPGPYISMKSRSLFTFLGRKVAFLGLDCRTERTRDIVVSRETYKLVFERARREIIKGDTKHLILLLGVPIAYPRLVWLETLLTSKIMDPFKALARMKILGGFLNNFDVEILDDLDDHWTAKNHKSERNWLIKQLQQLAVEKSVRITILGGDVHLGGIGQFYSNPALGLPRDRDHRYMPNIISSAIVNTPPPPAMADILNKRNKVHHLDDTTDEDMFPIFQTDVDGKPRNNKCLMPRRNYCILTEYDPSSANNQPHNLSKTSSRLPKFLRSNSSKKTDEVSSNIKGKEISRTPTNVGILGSLELTLRVEVNQRCTDGMTSPYRLVVPPLTLSSYEDMVKGLDTNGSVSGHGNR